MASSRRGSEGLPGVAVDAAGGAVIDPSENVYALVRAEARRQDDLREASERAREREADVLERCRVRDADLNERHNKELRDAEAARIDANRATDLAAVASAAQVQATAVTALAKSTTDIAEAARVAMTAAATTVGDNLNRTIEPITRQIAELQRVQTLQLGAASGSADTVGERRASVGLIIAAVVAAFAILGFFVTAAGLVVVLLSQ